MKKMFVAILALALIVDGTAVFAGKSYSSGRSGGGGRSYSSGSSRSGSSYSGRSYGGGSSYSGRSYSSGSSKPSYTPPSRPSYTPPSSSGKSYSSGSSSKPYTPSYTPPSSSKPSGKSYSSGSSSKPYTPSYTPPSNPTPSGKSYTSGGSAKPSYSGGSSTSGQPPPGKPSGSGFNSGMSQSAKHEESRVRYQAANAPKSTYTPPGPSSKPVDIKPNSPQVQTVRRYVTHERYVTYDNRAGSFYGGYYGHPVYYHDSFSPFLWGWIMSDTINSHQRAMWMYHHQNDMDQARYQAMLAKDARLQAEIDALKAQNLARDPSYVPEQMKDNPDLMYSKAFVDASYNPVAVEPEPASGAAVVAVLFWTIVILTVGGIFIYFLFVKEY